jgi:hypothetical protein
VAALSLRHGHGESTRGNRCRFLARVEAADGVDVRDELIEVAAADCGRELHHGV